MTPSIWQLIIVLIIPISIAIIIFLVERKKIIQDFTNINHQSFYKKFFWVNLSFTGRLNRSDFWIYGWFFWAIIVLITNFFNLGLIYIMDTFEDTIPEIFLWILIIILLPIALFNLIIVIVPFWAVHCKRLHDHNKSGWLLIITLIPFIGGLFYLYIIIINWFMKGTEGANKYGPEYDQNNY